MAIANLPRFPQPTPPPWTQKHHRPQPQVINTINDAIVPGGKYMDVQAGIPGFGLDLDGSGKYEPGQDAVLAFDLDHNGTISPKEVTRSKEILNAVDTPTIRCKGLFGREIDLVNPAYEQAKEMGLVGDGPITAEQLADAGARVLIAQDGEGFLPNWSVNSVYNFPMGNGQRGAIETLDPTGGYTTVSTPTW